MIVDRYYIDHLDTQCKDCRSYATFVGEGARYTPRTLLTCHNCGGQLREVSDIFSGAKHQGGEYVRTLPMP